MREITTDIAYVDWNASRRLHLLTPTPNCCRVNNRNSAKFTQFGRYHTLSGNSSPDPGQTRIRRPHQGIKDIHGRNMPRMKFFPFISTMYGYFCHFRVTLTRKLFHLWQEQCSLTLNSNTTLTHEGIRILPFQDLETPSGMQIPSRVKCLTSPRR
jgi:hypothetical protein